MAQPTYIVDQTLARGVIDVNKLVATHAEAIRQAVEVVPLDELAVPVGGNGYFLHHFQ